MRSRISHKLTDSAAIQRRSIGVNDWPRVRGVYVVGVGITLIIKYDTCKRLENLPFAENE
ncbi:hypothetical protein NQ318_018785 [Aromia moschata]|uniref:Uncharacterized protein n=1 Tax=Aromia moschata TaxID=1265417 RepID=A0AAV8ZFX2_9CUCU|nr:hypothetical protein NQ318_018785 [Aromia moschata]